MFLFLFYIWILPIFCQWFAFIQSTEEKNKPKKVERYKHKNIPEGCFIFLFKKPDMTESVQFWSRQSKQVSNNETWILKRRLSLNSLVF